MLKLFLGQYIRNTRTVGAITPSSRYLARKMVKSVDFVKAKVIVEYGPGTGVFTAGLIAQKKPTTKLIIVEQNSAFYDVLHDKYAHYENVTLVHDSVVHIETILQVYGIK